MADSQKGASTTPANPKEKTPLSDGNIGKEFLSSWKSSNDDAMDFNFEPISKGNKKSTTKFANLDMDFNLDDDFSKLSSFKVDIPDLDFSSPPRKSSKPKRSEEKSSTGNRHEKEDHFSFSFDFPEMDDFDFGSSSKKGETKSTKKPDGKEVASEGCESQDSKVHMAKGFDAFDDEITMELPVSKGVAAQKVKTSPADVSDINSMKDNCPSKSVTFRTSVEANLQQPSQSAIKDSDQEKHLLEEKMFKQPYTEPVIEDLAVQSAGENDRVVISVPKQQIEASSIGRNDDSGGVQNGHQNMDTEENLDHANLQCKDSPLNITASEKDDDERNKSSRDASLENMGRTEQSHSDLNLKDGSTTSVSRKTVHSQDSIELQNSNPVVLAPLNSEMALDTHMGNEQKTEVHLEPIGDTMAIRKDKEGGVRSKYFKKPVDSTPHKDQASSPEITVFSTNKNKLDAGNLTSSDEMRVELNANSAQEGSKLVTNSQSCHEELKDGNSVILGSGQKLKSSSNARDVSDTNGAPSGQQVLANSRLHDNGVTTRKPNLLGNLKSVISSRIQIEASGNTPKSSDQTMMNSKLVVSRTESIHNSRIVSADGNKLSSLKDGLKKPDSSILRTSRTTGANNDVPGATTLQRDTTAFRNNMKNMEVPRNTVSKISHPAESTGKQTPQTPSLKRKSFEVSNIQDFSPLKSLKRLSKSPTESRIVKENSEDASDKLACDRQRWEESKTKKNTSEHLKSALEVPREVNMREPDILLSMEDNGNVEKAEAYAKDLENMCNILRKKHEEAKELLVRAMVNNNNLLMLHHPIYQEKIRAFQNFAARLMSRELQT